MFNPVWLNFKTNDMLRSHELLFCVERGDCYKILYFVSRTAHVWFACIAVWHAKNDSGAIRNHSLLSSGGLRILVA